MGRGGKGSNTSGLIPFTKNNPATAEMRENRKNTMRERGKFRVKAIKALDKSVTTVRLKNIKRFLDADKREIPKDKQITLSQVYYIDLQQPTYQTIIDTMIRQAASGDRHAREQLITLVQGYKEAEAESHDAMKEFFDKIIVGYEQPPLDITPYEELNRQID